MEPQLSRTGSVDQAGLGLKRATCLCLPCAVIKGVHHNQGTDVKVDS